MGSVVYRSLHRKVAPGIRVRGFLLFSQPSARALDYDVWLQLSKSTCSFELRLSFRRLSLPSLVAFGSSLVIPEVGTTIPIPLATAVVTILRHSMAPPSSLYFTPRALSCPTPACSGFHPLPARSTRDAHVALPPTSPNPTRPIRRPCLMHIARSAHHSSVAGAFCTSAARARASYYVLSLDLRVLTPTARLSRRHRLSRPPCLPRTSRGLSTSSCRVPVRRPSPRISTSGSSPSCHVSYCC